MVGNTSSHIGLYGSLATQHALQQLCQTLVQDEEDMEVAYLITVPSQGPSHTITLKQVANLVVINEDTQVRGVDFDPCMHFEHACLSTKPSIIICCICADEQNNPPSVRVRDYRAIHQQLQQYAEEPVTCQVHHGPHRR